jgi:hypothetical protein
MYILRWVHPIHHTMKNDNTLHLEVLSFLIKLCQFDSLSWVIDRRANKLLIKVRNLILAYWLTLWTYTFWGESIPSTIQWRMINGPSICNGYHFWLSNGNSTPCPRWYIGRIGSKLIINIRDHSLDCWLTLWICTFWGESISSTIQWRMINWPFICNGYHFWLSNGNLTPCLRS